MNMEFTMKEITVDSNFEEKRSSIFLNQKLYRKMKEELEKFDYHTLQKNFKNAEITYDITTRFNTGFIFDFKYRNAKNEKIALIKFDERFDTIYFYKSINK